MHRSSLLAATLCLLLPGCALFDGSDADVVSDPDPEIYDGFFALGFEDSTFEPCGRAEVWKVVFVDEATLRTFQTHISEVISAENNPMYVRLRGTLGPKGTFPGLFITYDRELEITETLEVRPIRESDCR